MNEAKTFTGLSGALRTSPWLAGEDLVGIGEVQCVIEQVLIYDEVMFDGGRKEKNVPTLKFKDKQKQLVLRTSANRKVLVRMFGSNTKEWIGKLIYIYFEPDVKFAGKAVGGIRIKEKGI
jgi:hypothetical protein|tara:strand:- start:2941 stop:3300 length:360 start_codon:yes stop_codon:yes gene_type:complete